MGLALVKAAKTIRAQSLQNAHIHVGVVVLHESFAVEIDEAGEAVEIMVEKLLAQRRRQVGLAVVEQRRDVVLQRALAPALVIEEKRLPVAQHHVAALKIAIKKIIVIGGEQEFGQSREIEFERLFVEKDSGQAQKVVLEIIQIPGDGLAIETRARIADLVIQIAAGLHLKARQHGDDFAISLNRRRRDGYRRRGCCPGIRRV